MTFRGLTLDPFQEKAIRFIEQGESVIVAAPTGAGKTIVADYAISKAVAQEKQIIYTATVKALSNQKYRDFSASYPGKVGIITGDLSLDASSPVLIMTTEIFRNTIFDDPGRLQHVDHVVGRVGAGAGGCDPARAGPGGSADEGV